MKKTKGMTKRLTALFLAVTFLTGTLSAGMNVEAAGKTVYMFYGINYEKETADYSNLREYELTDISHENSVFTLSAIDQIYACGYNIAMGNIDKFLLVPRMADTNHDNTVWIKLNESKFGGYRLRAVTDNKRDSSWKTEKRVNFDFTLTVTAPFMKDDNKYDGYDGKVLYRFTQDDFDKNGYCKKTMSLPVVKGMSFSSDRINKHMYVLYYESKDKKNFVNISLLPADEETFVEYMSRRSDYNKVRLDESFVYAMIQKRSQTVKFPIIYDLNGGKNHKNNPDSYMPKQKVVLKNPSKTGYVFKGWEVTDNNYGHIVKSSSSILAPGNILKDNTIRKNSYGKACLKAVWERKPNWYDVSYKLNSGKNNNSNEKAYNSKKGLKLKSPSRKGYSFKGWYYDSKFKNKVKNNTISKGTTRNIKVYAKWKKKTYTIKYVNAGKHKNPKKYTVTSKTIKLKSPKKTGYTFKGWYSDKKCTKKVTVIKKGSAGNRTLYAKWQKVKK